MPPRWSRQAAGTPGSMKRRSGRRRRTRPAGRVPGCRCRAPCQRAGRGRTVDETTSTTRLCFLDDAGEHREAEREHADEDQHRGDVGDQELRLRALLRRFDRADGRRRPAAASVVGSTPASPRTAFTRSPRRRRRRPGSSGQLRGTRARRHSTGRPVRQGGPRPARRRVPARSNDPGTHDLDVLVEQLGRRSIVEPSARADDPTWSALVADDHGRHHERADDDRRREQDREDEAPAPAALEQLRGGRRARCCGRGSSCGLDWFGSRSATASMNSSDRRGGW